MPSYKFYIYTKDTLVHEAKNTACRLSPDYDFTIDRYRILVRDDASIATPFGEIAQIATVQDMDGNVIVKGQMIAPAYDELRGANGGVFIDRIEVAGTHVGFASSEELIPGLRYPILASGSGGAGTTYMANNSVPCFCEGAMIETEEGPVPIEEIVSGQKVMTLDHGAQPVLWAGRFSVSPLQLSRDINLYPVTFSPNSIGPDCPTNPLSISGNHQILLSDAEIQLYFGEDEALAPARRIAQAPSQKTSTLCPLTFHHLLFAEHEIICANGLWCESFFPSPQALNRLSTKDQWDIDHLLGLELDKMQTARRTLENWECTVLTPRKTTQFRAALRRPPGYRQSA